MTDTTFIDWPFFDDRHRAWRRDFAAWCEAYSFRHDDDTDDICRSLVRDLGRDGWLRACVPASGGGLYDKLDVRTIALSRDTLAFHGGLADFALSLIHI